MLINPIASGSSGNAYYISDGQSSLLLDAGIPLAQIQAGCGYKVSQLSGKTGTPRKRPARQLRQNRKPGRKKCSGSAA